MDTWAKTFKDTLYADMMKDWQKFYVVSDTHAAKLDINSPRVYTHHTILEGDIAVGYTHYWKMSKPLTVTPAQRALISEVLSDHGDIIKTYQNDDKGLHFNGVDDHEDFYVEYGRKRESSFCKTARKDYDVVVCKVLHILSASDGFTFSSDGDIADGEENWGEANKWWAKNKSRLDIKSGMVDNKPSSNEGAMDASRVTYLRLENTTKGHNKFWELNAVSEKEVEAKWGSIGKAPIGSKVYMNAEAEKLVKEKLKHGYKVVGMR